MFVDRYKRIYCVSKMGVNRGKVNKYLYNKRKSLQLRNIRDQISVLMSDSYHIRVVPVKEAHLYELSNKFSPEMLDQDYYNSLNRMKSLKYSKEVLKVTPQGYKRKMLNLSNFEIDRKFKAHSNSINYRVIIFTENCDELTDSFFEEVKSKHLAYFIKEYIRKTIIPHLIELERKLKVKLHLEEPNEQEQLERDRLKRENLASMRKNMQYVTRTVFEKTINEDLEKVKTGKQYVELRRLKKIHSRDDQLRLLDAAKIRFNENKITNNIMFSFNLTLPNGTKDSVLDKSMETRSNVLEIKGKDNRRHIILK